MTEISRLKKIQKIRKQLKLTNFSNDIVVKKICIKCGKRKHFYNYESLLICEKCKRSIY